MEQEHRFANLDFGFVMPLEAPLEIGNQKHLFLVLDYLFKFILRFGFGFGFAFVFIFVVLYAS